MEWTKEEHESVKREVDRGGHLDNDEAQRALAEIERGWAEIEAACAARDACGMELQTCRATLEEERRDGDAQRAEIDRLTAELAGQSKAATVWRDTAGRHLARVEAAERDLASLRAAYEATLADLMKEQSCHRGTREALEKASALGAQAVASMGDTSLEARSADAKEAYFASLNKHRDGQPDRAWVDVARAVDASRPGLTEEQARAWTASLNIDVGPDFARFMAAQEKVTAALLRASRGETGPTPTWGEQAIAEHRRAADLHAPKEAPAPGHVAISRAVLSRLVDATQRNHDVREAREAAEHVLHQDALRHEPARTDPLFARAIAEATQHDARLVPPAPDLSDLAAGKARGLVRSGASSADLLDRLTSEAIPRLAVEATAADPDRSRLRAAVSDAAGIVLAIATLRGAK